MDPSSPEPLYRQICTELRAAILSRRIGPGETVPSTRELALSLGVSRTTVKQSYDILISEGYLEGTIGSGTRVCPLLPEQSSRIKQKAVIAEKQEPVRPRLSATGRAILDVTSEPDYSELSYNFTYCRPDVRLFPHKQWRRHQAEGLLGVDPDLFNYLDGGHGHLPLREAIAKYLARSRAVRSEADQIVVVNGAQQGLSLLAQVLLDKGDRVVLENPGYSGALDISRQFRACVVPVPVDREGLVVNALPSRGAKFLYVTPSHQFPTGAVLPLSRRLELLRWAAATTTIVIEDDYDSEFRFGSRPVPALQGLDDAGVVAYLGTFSKTMYPAMRVGYVVLPRSLVNAVERAKWTLDRHVSLVDQAALARFIEEGAFERHVKRMRTVYGQRRDAVVASLAREFGDRVSVLGDPAGLHVMIRLRTTHSDDDVVKRAASTGVGVIPASIYYAAHPPGGEFVLGYGQLTEDAVSEGVARLARALE